MDSWLKSGMARGAYRSSGTFAPESIPSIARGLMENSHVIHLTLSNVDSEPLDAEKREFGPTLLRHFSA